MVLRASMLGCARAIARDGDSCYEGTLKRRTGIVIVSEPGLTFAWKLPENPGRSDI